MLILWKGGFAGLIVQHLYRTTFRRKAFCHPFAVLPASHCKNLLGTHKLCGKDSPKTDSPYSQYTNRIPFLNFRFLRSGKAGLQNIHRKEGILQIHALRDFPKVLICMGKVKALLKGSVNGFSQAMGGKGMPRMGFIFQNLRTPPIRSNGGNRHNFPLGKVLHLSPFFQDSANALMAQGKVFSFRRALPNGMHITGTGAH